jgi:hypothetical protein
MIIGPKPLQVYHGTDVAAAAAVKRHGLRREASGGGYFGHGFYVTEDDEMARANYAGREGVVLVIDLTPGSCVLDLANAADWDRWIALTQGGRAIFDPSYLGILIGQHRIDGVKDKSMDGICVYNLKKLELREVVAMKNADPEIGGLSP